MFAPFVTAFRTLTIVRVPGKETKEFPLSIVGFPLVGMFLGGVVWVFSTAADLRGPSSASLFALLALATESTLTGALHLDGLGDCFDAFPGRKDRSRILEILNDSRMGTFGVCAIVFDLLFKFLLWRFWFEHATVWIICLSLVLSRTMQGTLLITMPNARKEGIAAAFAGLHQRRYKILGGMLLSIVGLFAIFVSPTVWIAIGSLLAAFIVTTLWALFCGKKIGGITGDCLGAANELVEVAVLLTAALIWMS